jgi:hypothetical protein
VNAAAITFAHAALLAAGAYILVGVVVAVVYAARAPTLRGWRRPQRLALVPGAVCLWPAVLTIMTRQAAPVHDGAGRSRIELLGALAVIVGLGLIAALVFRPDFPVQPAIPGTVSAK